MSDWTSPDPDTEPPDPSPPPPPGGAMPPPPMPPPRAEGGWSGGRRIPLRPMRYGEILDASFKLFRLTFVQVMVLVVLTLGAFTLLQVFVQPPAPGVLSDPADFSFTATDGVRFGISFLVAILTQLFVLPLVRGAATGIAVEADRGGDTSWQAGLRTARALAGRLIGLSLLLLVLGIGVLVLLALVIGLPIALFVTTDLAPLAVVWGLLGIVLALLVFLVGSALVYLTVPILLVEDLRPVAAVWRSIELVRPQLLRVVGLVFVTLVLLVVVGSVLGVVQLPFAFLGGRIGQAATAVVTILGYVVTVPFEANIALLLYVDARVRTEGLDVAVLTAELDEL